MKRKKAKAAGWAIETGGERWRRTASRTADIMQVVADAFSLRAPKNPGFLTRVRPDGSWPWSYVDTCEALRLAGFDIGGKK